MWSWLKENKIAKIILALDAVFLVAFIAFFIYDRLKTATLTILVTPADSSIIINGKTYKNGTYRFLPGKISATIKHENFEEKTEILNLEKKSDTRLYAFLEQPNHNFSYYRSNLNDFKILQTVASDSESAKEFITNFSEELDLKNFLPIKYSNDTPNPNEYINLTISYETEECKEKPFCLLISDTFSGHYNFALSLLKQYGYNPNDYEIIYNYMCEKGDTKKCYRI